jgi:hypothetical protein
MASKQAGNRPEIAPKLDFTQQKGESITLTFAEIFKSPECAILL